MDADDVRQLRRWLWAELSVRSATRPAPCAARRWGGDARAACNELAAILLEQCRAGAIEPDEAKAWAADAALTGERVRKESIAQQLGLSVRGLGGRLARVDKVLASALKERLPATPSALSQAVVEETAAALAGEATAILAQRWELADAYRILARERAGLGAQPASGLRGADRSKRSRELRRIRAALPRLAARSSELPRLQRPGGGPSVIVIPYSLASEPGAAVAEFERAWANGAAEAYPILADHAFRLTPSLRVAGALPRLRLLEITVNVLRDTESLLAIPAGTMWLRESLQSVGDTDRRIIAALRGRAHILQLHGYLDVAARALDDAIHRFRDIRYTSQADRRLEWMGLVTRRVSVEVARGAAADIDMLTDQLGRLSAFDEAVDHPMLPRLQLHLQALKIAAEGWHGTPSRRLMHSYSRAQEKLIDSIARASGAQPLAMVDTLLDAALRVGEGGKLITWLMTEVLPPLGVDVAWGNQFDRMRQRLRQATRKVPDPDELGLPMVESKLRVAGTVPTKAAYRV